MGLERDIQKAYRRAISSDLKTVSRWAQAYHTSGHTGTRPPLGGAGTVETPTATTTNPINVFIREDPFVVQQVILAPLEHEELEEIAKRRRAHLHDYHHVSHVDDELVLAMETANDFLRRFRLTPPIEREKRQRYWLQYLRWLEHASKAFISEGPSFVVTPRHFPLNAAALPSEDGRPPYTPRSPSKPVPVISVGDMDYVLVGYPRSKVKALFRKGDIRPPARGYCERWPEVVKIKRANRIFTYRRADLWRAMPVPFPPIPLPKPVEGAVGRDRKNGAAAGRWAKGFMSRVARDHDLLRELRQGLNALGRAWGGGGKKN